MLQYIVGQEVKVWVGNVGTALVCNIAVNMQRRFTLAWDDDRGERRES